MLAELEYGRKGNIRFRIDDDVRAVFLRQGITDQIENLKHVLLFLYNTERPAVVGVLVIGAGRVNGNRADDNDKADRKMLDDFLTVLLQADMQVMPPSGGFDKASPKKPRGKVCEVVVLRDQSRARADDLIGLPRKKRSRLIQQLIRFLYKSRAAVDETRHQLVCLSLFCHISASPVL